MSKLGYHPLAATFVSAHVSESCLAQESTRFIISPQFAKRLGFSRDRLSAWHTTAWIQGEWSGATDNCLGEEKMFKIWKSIIGKLRVTCCVSTTSGPLKFDLGQNDNIAILKALDEEDPVEIQKYIIELLSCRFFIYFKIEPLVTRVRHWVQCEIFWLFFLFRNFLFHTWHKVIVAVEAIWLRWGVITGVAKAFRWGFRQIWFANPTT